jgi:Ran GTPase-activating protein (RanGAP) involved in mRNA processing and transport
LSFGKHRGFKAQECRIEANLGLDLSDNQIDEIGIKALASSDWVRLRLLYISNNNIRNKGMSFLAKANWPKLYYLSIVYCSITVDGLKQIAHTRWSTKM